MLGSKKKLLLGGGLAAATVMIGAIVAFACTSLSTLNLSSASGTAGSQVTVTGSAFAASTPVGGSPSSVVGPVILHWGTADGPVLGQGFTDATGAFGPVSVTVPQTATAGYYEVVATEADGTGAAIPGTPTRAAFQVIPAGGSAAQAPGAAHQAQTAAPAVSSGISTGIVVLLVAVGAGGIILLGLGAAYMGGALRRGATSESRRR